MKGDEAIEWTKEERSKIKPQCQKHQQQGGNFCHDNKPTHDFHGSQRQIFIKSEMFQVIQILADRISNFPQSPRLINKQD